MGKQKSEYAENLRKLKSQLLASTLKEKRDVHAFSAVKRIKSHLDWESRSGLMIDEEAWKHIKRLGHDPKEVFCHPAVLIGNPITSLYYRGLAGLSIKAVKDYVGSIENLENGSSKTKLSDEKAVAMAQTYNTFVCSIIKNTTDWTLEDGKRTVIATLGITFDGVMRNKVGEIAEERIRAIIVDWLKSENLIAHTASYQTGRKKRLQKQFTLRNNVVMEFASEPDISFLRGEELIAVIEIKGGIDPAGALERYGAALKSFEDSIKKLPKCKTFYVGGVFTDELNRRMDADRLVEKSFNVIDILQKPEARDEFLKEVFHHAVRVM